MVSCDEIASYLCNDPWVSLSRCGGNEIPGKVSDTCQAECGMCRGKSMYINFTAVIISWTSIPLFELFFCKDLGNCCYYYENNCTNPCGGEFGNIGGGTCSLDYESCVCHNGCSGPSCTICEGTEWPDIWSKWNILIFIQYNCS